MKTENLESIIELIEIQKATLETNPFLEMDFTIRNINRDVLKELAKYFEPTFDSDETINNPNEVSPYYWFSVRINERLFVIFRTNSLQIHL